MSGPPRDRRILASGSPGELRVALLEADRLVEAWIERPGLAAPRIGDLHRARITARAPAMGGAFAALADGVSGFLPESECDAATPADRVRALAEGRVLGLRVTREAQGGKGPRVTARLDAAQQSMVGEGGAPALLARGPEATLRLALAHPEAAVATDDAALVARLRPCLGARLSLLRAPAFDDALEAEFAELLSPELDLPGGGRMLIHSTPGLTAIDIDAGRAGGGGEGARRALNEAAIAEAARQIRLRNLGGAILLDLAGLPQRRRATLMEPMRAALATDPRVPRLVGMTGLGLFEIVRPRAEAPLHEVLGVPVMPWPASALTEGLAALRQAARDAAARPAAALALRAAPAVAGAIRGLPGALDEYRAGAGRAIELRPDAALAPRGWEITDA